MPPHIPHIAEVGEQRADGRLRLAAVRTFEISILNDSHRRLPWAAQVVAIGIDRHGEVGDDLGGAEERAQLERFGQHLGHPEDEPGEPGRAQRRGQDAELGLLKLRPAEGQRGDEQ